MEVIDSSRFDDSEQAGRLSMATQMQPMTREGSTESGRDRAPFIVPLLNPIVRRLMGVGVPLGPNALLSVRGRKTGQLRTTPIAVVDIGGRRGGGAPHPSGHCGGSTAGIRGRGPPTRGPWGRRGAGRPASRPGGRALSWSVRAA